MKQAADLDRKAAVLGRKLVKGLETDDDDDYYDVTDMEFSGIVFSPVKRYLLPLPGVAIPKKCLSSYSALLSVLVEIWHLCPKRDLE